jgi:hypothetical protein
MPASVKRIRRLYRRVNPRARKSYDGLGKYNRLRRSGR